MRYEDRLKSSIFVLVEVVDFQWKSTNQWQNLHKVGGEILVTTGHFDP